MKIKAGMKTKIRNGLTPYPIEMWAVVCKNGLLELEDTDPEHYMMLFPTEEAAQAHIDQMNQEFWTDRDGSKVFWYKNRGNQPIKINTASPRWRSKYVPIEKAFQKLFA